MTLHQAIITILEENNNSPMSYENLRIKLTKIISVFLYYKTLRSILESKPTRIFLNKQLRINT